MIVERYSLIGFLVSVIIIFLNFYLIKKRKITSSTFTIWLLIGVFISIISLIPSVYLLIFGIFGTQFLLSSITAAGFLFLISFIFYLNIMIDNLKDKVLKLTIVISASKIDFKKEKTHE